MSTSTAYKQPISVLVVIHTTALDILLLERAAHPGYWQSVTGSREGNEALIDTARREVFEETGIDTLKYQLTDWQLSHRYEIFPLWRHRYAPGVAENEEHVFGLLLPERIDIRISPSEHRNWRWESWEKAAQACFSWSNQDAITRLALKHGKANSGT